jgi:hypothetical protein
MLDWVTGLIGYDASNLRLGEFKAVNRNGEVDWVKERPESVTGSFEAKMLIGRGTSTTQMRDAAERLNLVINPEVLWISGNPVKFLQGHNVFGASAQSLAPIVRTFVRSLPADMRPPDADSELWPAVKRSRVDIAVMIQFESHDDVHEWLQAAGSASRSRHGRALVSGHTVYWGQHSRRWSDKAYCKSCELLVHPVADLKVNNLLREYCRAQLRMELTLRTPELKDRGTLSEAVFWEYFDRIEFGGIDMARVKEVENLPKTAQFCFLKWMNGADVMHMYPRTTIWRYRRVILKELGVDVSISFEEQKKIVKRIKYDGEYLRAHEIKIPPGYLQGLLFKPEPCPVYSA